MNSERKIEREEVDKVDTPAKARVEDAREADGEEDGEEDGAVVAPSPFEAQQASDESARETMERKKDYLEGFLARQPMPDPDAEESDDLQTAVEDALKEIYDPEIPVNIYDLGLIYGVEITPNKEAIVTMTLTTPHCPVAESMPGEVELRVGAVPGVGHAEVNLVWDPPWSPDKMTDEARLELGML
ncbi:MAG: SUF system Fe-S cluster assembly protein [Parasphingopyxis sp.]|nr:SUF system Fe-S cluster assembly protein [Sphingomonadales bacterium]